MGGGIAVGTSTAIRPQSRPQELFLSSPADIVIYGGAAGGGKTWSLLLEPLRHIRNPDFRGAIFRRTSPQITNPGGLYDESNKLYPVIGGSATRPDSGITWTFRHGSRVRFAHLQHDKTVHDWQGAQIPFLGFDELTHFEEAQWWYMFSRNRSLTGIRPYIRATTNPSPGWVATLISWWIGADGYAIPERGGVIRWFVRYGGELVWANDPDELERKFPGVVPKSLTFIPATLQDNRILMETDPGYLANLLALPLVERERLLHGNWLITPSGGKVFNRAWFSVIHAADVPKGGVDCRFWDVAATAKELAGDDPDYTAGVKIRAVGDTYYVTDVIEERLEPGPTDKLIRATAERDAQIAVRDGAKYLLRWEKQPAAAGKRDNRHLVKLLDGFDAAGIAPEGDKVTRAMPLSRQVEAGFVVVVNAPWTERFLTHMHHQPDWDHDDIMDASAGAYNGLIKSRAESGRVDFYGRDDAPEPVEIETDRSESEIDALIARYKAGDL